MESIFRLIEQVNSKTTEPMLRKWAAASGFEIGEGDDKLTLEEVNQKLEQTQEYMYAQVSGTNFKGDKLDIPVVPFKEAMNSADVSIILPRVISTVLQEPVEPVLFLTNQIAETINVPDDAPLTIEFPTISAIDAFDMSENGEYQIQALNFQQHMTSLRMGKIGTATSLSEETIRQSLWPMVQLNLRIMANAINRKVENTLFQTLTSRAVTVFDNENASMHTTGVEPNGAALIWNGSFSYYDLVKMCGIIIGNRYNPTHFLAHPLSWGIFANDPIIRASFYHQGQLGGSVWTTAPQFNQQVNFPFGMTYVPYYAIPYVPGDTLTGAGSSLTAAMTSDLYLIDGRNSLYMLTRGEMQMDDMDDWYRDSKMMKARKYVGITAKDGGKGMVVAKSVRMVRNYEALYTVRTVSS